MKSIQILVFLIFTTTLFFGACKKNEEPEPVTFSGQINDPVQGIPVANATVKIALQQSANNNVINTGFVVMASTTTDANGNYSITFSPENPVTYRLIVEKNLYFGQQTDYSHNAIATGSNTTTNFNINPVGWFKVNIKNVNPVDNDDVILFQNTSENNGCATCCSNTAVSFTGMNVDTYILCQRVAHPNITYSWFVTKNGNLTTFNSSTSGIVGDTAVVTINY